MNATVLMAIKPILMEKSLKVEPTSTVLGLMLPLNVVSISNVRLVTWIKSLHWLAWIPSDFMHI